MNHIIDAPLTKRPRTQAYKPYLVIKEVSKITRREEATKEKALIIIGAKPQLSTPETATTPPLLHFDKGAAGKHSKTISPKTQPSTLRRVPGENHATQTGF